MTPVEKSIIYSLVLPGLGQYANGQKAKAIVLMVLGLIIFTGMTVHLVIVLTGYINGYMEAVFSIAENTATIVSPQALIQKLLHQLVIICAIWGAPAVAIWGVATADAYVVAKRKLGESAKKR